MSSVLERLFLNPKGDTKDELLKMCYFLDIAAKISAIPDKSDEDYKLDSAKTKDLFQKQLNETTLSDMSKEEMDVVKKGILAFTQIFGQSP